MNFACSLLGCYLTRTQSRYLKIETEDFLCSVCTVITAAQQLPAHRRTMAQSLQVREGCQPRDQTRLQRVQTINNTSQKLSSVSVLTIGQDVVPRTQQRGVKRLNYASCGVPQVLGGFCGSAFELNFKKENSEIADTQQPCRNTLFSLASYNCIAIHLCIKAKCVHGKLVQKISFATLLRFPSVDKLFESSCVLSCYFSLCQKFLK